MFSFIGACMGFTEDNIKTSKYVTKCRQVDLEYANDCKKRGNVAYNDGQYSTALAEYTRGLSYFLPETAPGEPKLENQETFELMTSLLANRSAAHNCLKMYDEALKDAEEVIKRRPRWVKGYFRKAEVLYSKKQYFDALKLFETAATFDENEHSTGDLALRKKIVRCNYNLEDIEGGFLIHQIYVPRDLCQKGWFTPIQNVLFEFAKQMRNFIYIVENLQTRQCVVVDAVSFLLIKCWDIDGLLAYVKLHKLDLVGAILTHYHIDHCGGIPPAPYDKYRVRVSGLARLVELCPRIKVYMHRDEIKGVLEANPEFPLNCIHGVDDGEVLTLPLPSSKLDASKPTFLKFIHTPGHTPGSQCILVNESRLISGDTMFVGSCGRVDFPDSSKEDMERSLHQKIGRLDNDVVVYPGHDYGGEFTTIGQEKVQGVLALTF